MTTPTDLAAAVRAYLELVPYQPGAIHDASVRTSMRVAVHKRLHEALAAHDAKQPSGGERVRLAGYRYKRPDLPDLIEARSEEWHEEGPPHFYITATIPKPQPVPEVEGEVEA